MARRRGVLDARRRACGLAPAGPARHGARLSLGRGMSTADRSARSKPRTDLWVCHLGTVRYAEALELQERVRAARQSEAVPDTLLLLEHPAVYTRGRRAGAE